MTDSPISQAPVQQVSVQESGRAATAARAGSCEYPISGLGIVALAAAGALAVAAWRGRHRREGARIAAEETRMEPAPVVY